MFLQQPLKITESIGVTTLNLWEAGSFPCRKTKLYEVSFGKCFGETTDKRAGTTTACWQGSPYVVAKAATHWMIVDYREAYGRSADNALLCKHVCPFRFETRRIISSAGAISRGEKTHSPSSLCTAGVRRAQRSSWRAAKFRHTELYQTRVGARP